MKIDVNFGLRKRLSENVRAEPASFLNSFGYKIRLPLINTFPRETLAGMKLIALSTRHEGKDFFDAWHLLQPELDYSLVMGEAFKYANLFFDFHQLSEFFLDRVIANVEAATERELAACNQFILRPYWPDWQLVKNDLLFKLRQMRQQRAPIKTRSSWKPTARKKL
ncbi:hypothetical protein AUJ65_01300 [Candidatus Micrarchaeota archaeon CG1_02_51_15]|nr:MAG: hypothetical protein AUJ65_01300 [Candidatus Micrarchaeota archaeon CG1_02_51_15]